MSKVHMLSKRWAHITGIYRATTAQLTVQASAQNGTTTGFLWAHMPAAVTDRAARIRQILVTSQHSTALATPSGPRIVAARMTFTGTASGAALTAGKVDTDHGAASFSLRTAVTGLTPTLVANLSGLALCGALTAVGAYAPAPVPLLDANAEDEWPVIRPGEGVAIYQDVAGTTSDTRKITIALLWDEVVLES